MKNKKEEWTQLKDTKGGHIGLHLPCGDMIKGGFLNLSTQAVYFPIMAFVNNETGEMKIFFKHAVDQIGINNLKF